MEEEVRVPIESARDIVTARKKGRELAEALKFSSADATLIALAISELAHNIVTYAKTGEIRLKVVGDVRRPAIRVVAHDDGPGIEDVDQALRDGFSTSGGLGLGLPGVRRVVDDFRITSEHEHGTTVTVTKYRT